MFKIYDKERNVYLSQNNGVYFVTPDTNEAFSWKDKTKAENIIKKETCPKKYRDYSFEVIDLLEEDINLTDACVCAETEIPTQVDINSFLESFSNMQKRFMFLKNKISECELKILDVEHAMELQTFNVVKGYKYAKLIQTIRKERRVYKDEMQSIQYVLAAIDKDMVVKAEDFINRLDNRTYTPRILNDLF